MNKNNKNNKRIIFKKIIYLFMIFSFFISSTPYGLFEYYFSFLRDNNIVDKMWLAENSHNIVDRMFTKEASAAEVTVNLATTDTTDEFGPSPTVVFTTNQVGYAFFVDAGNDLVYTKTTNGGTNWATPVIVNNVLTGWTNVSVWYDRWTPGDDTGNRIHIGASDIGTGDAYYTYLDTNGDILKGNVVSVIPQTTFTAEVNVAPSITKGSNGDLFLTANFATTAGGYVYKSSDGNGDTWADITPSGWSNSSLDQIQLLPLKTDSDIIAIKAETASNAMKYQVYDEVLNTWAGTWTTIAGMTEDSTYDQWFSASLKKSTGNIYLTFSNYTNNAVNDIEFWSFSDADRAFVKKTDIRTNSNQFLSPVPLVEEETGNIYVAYAEGQTNFVYNGMGIGGLTYIYYHKSTDGGDTWSTRQGELNNNIADDYKYLRGNLNSTGSGRLFVNYYDDDDNNIYGTTINNSSVQVEANIDTSIIDATDEYGPSPSGVFLDEDIGYQFYVRTNNILDATDEFGPSPTVVFTDTNTGYVFFVDSPSQDLAYRKTLDGGLTWGGSVIIDTNIAGWTNVSVWYDMWTTEQTGTKIHIAASDDVSDDIYYTYLDTNGDILKGEMIMTIPGSGVAEANDGPPTITKGASGYLFISSNFLSPAGGKVYKSIDGAGDIWSDITPSLWSSISDDQFQLLPLNNNRDILAIRADTANDDIDYRIYDETLDTWSASWTTIAPLVNSATYDQCFSATLNKSTNDIYLTFANNMSNVNNDIEFWTFSDSLRSFRKSASNVISDTSSALAPVPFYKEDTGTLYVAYTRGTIAANMHVYYKSSIDGGATWSAESSPLSTTTDDFKSLKGNMMGTSKLFVLWYNDDTDVIRGDNILSPVSYDLPVNGIQSVVYRKTINGGGEWGPPYSIANMAGATSVAIWYDKWTPGDTTGTKIHIAFSDDQNDDYYYSSLDTLSGKITGPLPVILGTTITESLVGVPSITKGAGGDLFLSGNFNTTAGGKIAKSSNGGLSWTEITPSGWSSTDIDQIQLIPLIEDNDILAIRADTVNNDIDYRIYDETLDTWSASWTTIAPLVDNGVYDQWFSASLKKMTSDVYLSFASNTNNATNDIEFWIFSDRDRSWTKKTDVYSDSANIMMPVTLVDESSGDIYVAYLRGTLSNFMNVYYKKSTDEGLTWSAESETLSPGIFDDVMALRGNLLSSDRLYVFWYNDDLNDIYGNTVLKVEAPLISQISQSAFRFFENINSFDVGNPLSILNTVATLLNSHSPQFRLRLILSIFGRALSISEQNFKLQFSLKSGDCDSAFLGEVYEDITNNTDIAYYDNSSYDDGLALTANINDPTDASITSVVSQQYVENNSFTNSISEITPEQGGLWDFSLYYKGATSDQAYCFRVVKENGDLLDNYSEILPEVITAQYRSRGGGSVQHIEEVEIPDDEVVGGGEDGGDVIVLPVCSDLIDNDEDTFIDESDPNCHMDGLIENEYVPLWESETISPVSNTGGDQGGGGGDLGFFIRRFINVFDLKSFSSFQNSILGLAFNLFR